MKNFKVKWAYHITAFTLLFACNGADFSANPKIKLSKSQAKKESSSQVEEQSSRQKNDHKSQKNAAIDIEKTLDVEREESGDTPVPPPEPPVVYDCASPAETDMVNGISVSELGQKPDPDTKVLILKATGIANTVSYDISAVSAPKLQVICIDTGDIVVDMDFEISKEVTEIFFNMEGIGSKVNIDVRGTGKVGKFTGSVSGIKSLINVSGEGNYNCKHDIEQIGLAIQINCDE